MAKAIKVVTDGGAVSSVSVDESAALISMIERAARDQNVDIDKMERLYQMQERAHVRRAHQHFASAMVDARAEMSPVARNKKNQQTGSNYADITAISNAIDPIITKHGFAPTFGADVSPRENHERVVCDLLHKYGHEKRYFIDVPFDKTGIAGKVNKTDTHALASTHTYGRRLLKLMIFDLATFDDDGNAASAPVPVTEAQAIELRDWLEATGTEPEQFLAYFKAQSIAAFPAAKFDAAVAAFKKKAGKQ